MSNLYKISLNNNLQKIYKIQIDSFYELKNSKLTAQNYQDICSNNNSNLI